MKTNPFKYYAVAICLCANFVMLAQLPGAEDNNGGLEGAETPVAPIDGYVWVLATIGLTYVFLKLRAIYKQAANSQE
jgi:hypothetical protein